MAFIKHQNGAFLVYLAYQLFGFKKGSQCKENPVKMPRFCFLFLPFFKRAPLWHFLNARMELAQNAHQSFGLKKDSQLNENPIKMPIFVVLKHILN